MTCHHSIHALLHGPFQRTFLYSQSNLNVNLNHRSNAIWLGHTLHMLDIQLFLWPQLAPKLHYILQPQQFFSLSEHLTNNTVLCNILSRLNCFFGLSAHLTNNTVLCIIFSRLNCFFGLGEHLTDNTV